MQLRWRSGLAPSTSQTGLLPPVSNIGSTANTRLLHFCTWIVRISCVSPYIHGELCVITYTLAGFIFEFSFFSSTATTAATMFIHSSSPTLTRPRNCATMLSAGAYGSRPHTPRAEHFLNVVPHGWSTWHDASLTFRSARWLAASLLSLYLLTPRFTDPDLPHPPTPA
jgi:hypothetical protein